MKAREHEERLAVREDARAQATAEAEHETGNRKTRRTIKAIQRKLAKQKRRRA